jgi:hypothetical protein
MGRELLTHLARRILEIETTERSTPAAVLPLALPLPGGLPTGALVEMLSAVEGDGAWTLALLLAKAALTPDPGGRGGKMLVVADGQRSFYPPAAAGLGIDLQRMLILRPRTGAVSALLVQALRCPAVGAALGRFERLTSAEYRALQLATEAGGGIGFLLRPTAALGVPSFAALRLLVTPVAMADRNVRPTRFIEVEVLRVRGGKAGQRFVLEIDHETGHVRVPAGLAVATPAARAARAS